MYLSPRGFRYGKRSLLPITVLKLTKSPHLLIYTTSYQTNTFADHFIQSPLNGLTTTKRVKNNALDSRRILENTVCLIPRLFIYCVDLHWSFTTAHSIRGANSFLLISHSSSISVSCFLPFSHFLSATCCRFINALISVA